MPKVPIYEDEWYPVFTIAKDALACWGAYEIELTDDELERIRRAEIEFTSCQKLIFKQARPDQTWYD